MTDTDVMITREVAEYLKAWDCRFALWSPMEGYRAPRLGRLGDLTKPKLTSGQK